MDLERPASDGLLRLRAVPTTSTFNPGDTGLATREEEVDSSNSAPAAPDSEERTTTPATGTDWGDLGPAVGPWGEILTPEEAATIGGSWGDIGATSGAGWGQPTPTYLEAPGLPPADVAAIDPNWATRGTSWGEPPLPNQYTPKTPEHVQELDEEVTYEFFSKAAELPEPTEEAPLPEQGPQLISITGGEYLYHCVPMEGLPISEWPEAASFPQPLIIDDAVHSGDTDDITKIPKEALEHLSIQDFVADADAAIDKGLKRSRTTKQKGTNIIRRLSDIVRNQKHGISDSGTPHTPRSRTPSGLVFSTMAHYFFL
ncbi:unnamed protein product [Closterium sp. NIES-54]